MASKRVINASGLQASPEDGHLGIQPASLLRLREWRWHRGGSNTRRARRLESFLSGSRQDTERLRLRKGKQEDPLLTEPRTGRKKEWVLFLADHELKDAPVISVATGVAILARGSALNLYQSFSRCFSLPHEYSSRQSFAQRYQCEACRLNATCTPMACKTTVHGT